MPESDRLNVRVGKRFGDFQIVDLIGSGGMGQVFLATQLSLDRKVAVKFITAERYADDVNRRRFLREIKACSTLNHPNIVKIYSWGEEDGDLFLAMEYLEGRPLASYVGDVQKAEPPGLPPDFVLKITEDLLEALCALHPRGFIHRDIKPENIMVCKNNRTVLMDFGLVKIASDTKLTQTGRVLGTPRYLPPESLAGQPGDHRADIYQVGLVMCESLLGKIPFKQRELMEFVRGERKDRPTTPREARPTLPEPLQLLMQNALEVQPEARYQEAREMLADLQRVRDGKEIRATRELKQVGFPRVFPELSLAPAFVERYTFVSFVTRDPLITVVTAHDRKRDRKVQLRFLSPTLTSTCKHPDALFRSLQSLTQLEHPNVFNPSAMGREESVFYLSYPECADPTLKESMETRDTFERDAVVRAGVQLAAGLVALHGRGLVHGFLVPASILVSSGTGTLRITDAELGLLARHTEFVNAKESTTRLSYYSPPELLDGDPPTEASDLYSLAALLYRMLTGDFHVASASLEEDRKDPVRALLISAMDSDPKRRGGDLAAFGAALAKHAPAASPPSSKGGRGAAKEAAPLGEVLSPPQVKRAPERESARDLSLLDSSLPRRPPHPMFTRLLGALSAIALGIAVWLAYGGHAKVRDVQVSPEPNRATIKWTTSRPCETRLELGPDMSNMELVDPSGGVRTTTHSVVTPPLKPGTSYVFRILLPRQRKTDGYVFKTSAFDSGPVRVVFQGMKATLSWSSNVKATSIVIWSGTGEVVRIAASTTPALKHAAQLEGPLLLADSAVQIVSRSETGEEHRSRPLTVPGPVSRAAGFLALAEKLELPALVRRVASVATSPAEQGAVREKLEALRAAHAAALDELKDGVAALLDANGVPAETKANLYRAASQFAHLESACASVGLPALVDATALTGSRFALTPASRIEPAEVVPAAIPDAEKGFVPADTAGSRMAHVAGVRTQATVHLPLPPDHRPNIAEIEVGWDALPATRYVTVELPGHAELVFRAPPAAAPGPGTAFHGFDPVLLGTAAAIPLTVRVHTLPGAPANAARTVIRKIALRYKR